MAIRIGTNEEGGTFFTEGQALARLLDEKTDLGPVEVHPIISASVGGILGLHEGKYDFAISASNWIGRAMRGEDPFGEPIDLRMVAPANAGAMFFVVPASSDLRTVDELRGRRVAIGVRDGGMVQHIHTMFDALDIPLQTIEPLYETFPEGAEALIAGKVDAQWRAPAPNASMTDLASRLDVRVLEYGPGRLESILSKVGFYREARIPAEAFPGSGLEAPQVGVLNVIITHARVPEDVVYKVVATMAANIGALGRALPLYEGLSLLFDELKTKGRRALEPDGVPLHPGALRALHEAELIS